MRGGEQGRRRYVCFRKSCCNLIEAYLVVVVVPQEELQLSDVTVSTPRASKRFQRAEGGSTRQERVVLGRKTYLV